MASREQALREERLKKKQKLTDKGQDPYVISTAKERRAIATVLELFQKPDFEDIKVTLAGRIRSLRLHGKILFADLEDESGRLQILFKEDVLVKNFELLADTVDEGDFLEVAGHLMITKTGAKSVKADGWRLLTKSLRPIPDEYYGLKDTEQRLRKRYLDLLSNPETKEMFKKKSLFWQSIRQFLLNQGFWEFETAVLESVPGGAEAEPFVTHHNALDRDFYLRISLELPLKRLLVGGYEKVFEIGRIFRNEGIDDEHLQDYTQLEFYWAYADYQDLMQMVRQLYQDVIKKTLSTLKHQYQGQEIDWSGEWPQVDFYDLFEQHTGFSPDVSDTELAALAKKHEIETEEIIGRGRLLDQIYKKLIRPKLVSPQFLIRPPVEMEPLAKRDPEFPNRVQRFQILAGGTELGKGFSELNDPVDQRARFEEQNRLREQGDTEAQMMDEDFIEALEYGCPPAAGFGISERLFAVLMDKPIREIVFFPPMKNK